ncbi:MAG TPA: hypothetical protein VFK57_13170 [Vicinamibacterales bacterium]|nr:hypothetical protein [Vicinamibacterales bacterium]
MKRQITMAMMVGALSLVPLAGFASPAPVQKGAAKPAQKASVATHATRGTVKSVDDKTLVITRAGRNHSDMTFAVNGATQKDGTIAAGAPVSVRYREDGKTNVATAIRVESGRKHGAPAR